MPLVCTRLPFGKRAPCLMRHIQIANLLCAPSTPCQDIFASPNPNVYVMPGLASPLLGLSQVNHYTPIFAYLCTTALPSVTSSWPWTCCLKVFLAVPRTALKREHVRS